MITKVENTFDENYIEKFFETSFDLQNKFKVEFGINAQYYFVQNDNLNTSELKSDGFLKVSNE